MGPTWPGLGYSLVHSSVAYDDYVIIWVATCRVCPGAKTIGLIENVCFFFGSEKFPVLANVLQK
jgi:hypothetical protein